MAFERRRRFVLTRSTGPAYVGFVQTPSTRATPSPGAVNDRRGMPGAGPDGKNVSGRGVRNPLAGWRIRTKLLAALAHMSGTPRHPRKSGSRMKNVPVAPASELPRSAAVRDAGPMVMETRQPRSPGPHMEVDLSDLGYDLLSALLEADRVDGFSRVDEEPDNMGQAGDETPASGPVTTARSSSPSFYCLDHGSSSSLADSFHTAADTSMRDAQIEADRVEEFRGVDEEPGNMEQAVNEAPVSRSAPRADSSVGSSFYSLDHGSRSSLADSFHTAADTSMRDAQIEAQVHRVATSAPLAAARASFTYRYAAQIEALFGQLSQQEDRHGA